MIKNMIAKSLACMMLGTAVLTVAPIMSPATVTVEAASWIYLADECRNDGFRVFWNNSTKQATFSGRNGSITVSLRKLGKYGIYCKNSRLVIPTSKYDYFYKNFLRVWCQTKRRPAFTHRFMIPFARELSYCQ